jgi:tetratricopeptide (TPR) repeat protein
MDYLSLCLICKDENDYLPEWLDYHILMGVERFYIYDNESRVSLRQALGEYIERGWVVVVDLPGKAMQLFAYDHCLLTFGSNTFWLGFIDVDEFLVPKTKLDLKELLKEYEAFGGLAVSSLFFGSNNHKMRPLAGQVASYTQRTQLSNKNNELVKSIVQPGQVIMPNSPHDFLYKAGSWCVNENRLRVDDQRFPNSTAKIQLNHYYCRSEAEIMLKLERGRPSTTVPWSRERFDAINSMSVDLDLEIILHLNSLFQKENSVSSDLTGTLASVDLVKKLSVLAGTRQVELLEFLPTFGELEFRPEFLTWVELKSSGMKANELGDLQQFCQIINEMIRLQPGYPTLLVDLSQTLLQMADPEAAWQALQRAWQLAPNAYTVLNGMASFFLWTKNYGMLEKTCYLILEIDPHNVMLMAHLTEALLGQARFEDALKVGLPLLELVSELGDLPEGVVNFLVKKMADYLLGKKDYSAAVYLRQLGIKCLPDNVNMLLEFCLVLSLAGEKTRARGILAQVKRLTLTNPADRLLLSRLESTLASGKKHRH